MLEIEQSLFAKTNLKEVIPLYRQVKELIIGMVEDGRLKRGKALPSEENLCKLLKVSSITVRRSLYELKQEGWIDRQQGKGTFVTQVSHELLDKELEKILIVFPWKVDSTSFYSQGLISAFKQMERDKKYSIRIVSESSNYRNIYDHNKADGMIIIAPSAEDKEIILDMKNRGYKFVLLGASWSDWDVNYIDSDHAQGTIDAVHYLISSGHKEIALLNGPLRASNAVDCFEGYKKVMKSNSLPVKKQWVFNATLSFVSGKNFDSRVIKDWIKRIMLSSNKPTAVISAGHTLATHFYIQINEMGLKIPDDVSIISFDETPFNSPFLPPLTAVKQPLEKMANEAIKAVVNLMDNVTIKIQKKIKTELIIRESTQRKE